MASLAADGEQQGGDAAAGAVPNGPQDGAGLAAAVVVECEAEAAAAVEEFDKSAWSTSGQKYGMMGLLHLRKAMLPIECGPELKHLKLLNMPGATPAPVDGADDQDQGGEYDSRRRYQNGDRGDRKGKGKGQEKGKGRYVPDMGRTEILPGSARGSWWKNCVAGQDVLIREQVSLHSTELGHLPFGQYVQQAGPCEVFVNGAATGLHRMPVLPRGWVTVDAKSLGGPRYLKQVRRPSWTVVFQSGSAKGDIVVREGVSLDSDEVAVLLFGTKCEQTSHQLTLDDGIIRMPISWGPGVAKEPSNTAGSPRERSGWVTCDASHQGGPVFFAPCEDDDQDAPPDEMQYHGSRAARNAARNSDASAVDMVAAGTAEGGGSTWEKNRKWKVANLGSDPSRRLPLVQHAEPFAPGSGRQPLEEHLLQHLQDGDIVEQVGHSKKMRGYMVMPVRVCGPGEADDAPPPKEPVIGWVTRRVVDKARENPDDISWFVELRNGEEIEQKRRGRRNNRDQAA